MGNWAWGIGRSEAEGWGIGNWSLVIGRPGRVYEIIGLRHRLSVKPAPTGILTTIGRLGNASGETKFALVFAMPNK